VPVSTSSSRSRRRGHLRKSPMTEERPFAVLVGEASESTAMVVVEGSVDLATAAEFDAALTEAFDKHADSLLVDLTSMSFMDSTGLNALVHALERQRWSGRGFGIVSDDPRLAIMLEITRLDQVLMRFPSREAALEALSKQR
jgi:anti-anti-sigma factor